MKVHIGKEIEKIYKKRGIKLSSFADQLGTVPRNVYRIFEKEDINTDLLITVGNVLNYNFFKCYVQDDDLIANEPSVKYSKPQNKTKIMVEVELDQDEILKLGLKEKVLQALTK